jgi:hypothetical protein
VAWVKVELYADGPDNETGTPGVMGSIQPIYCATGSKLVMRVAGVGTGVAGGNELPRGVKTTLLTAELVTDTLTPSELEMLRPEMLTLED